MPVPVNGISLMCVQMHKQAGAFRRDGIASSTAENGNKTLNMLKGAPSSVRADSQMENRVQEKVDAVTGRSPHSLTHPVTDLTRQCALVPMTKDYLPIMGIGTPPCREVPVF